MTDSLMTRDLSITGCCGIAIPRSPHRLRGDQYHRISRPKSHNASVRQGQRFAGQRENCWGEPTPAGAGVTVWNSLPAFIVAGGVKDRVWRFCVSVAQDGLESAPKVKTL